MGPSGAQGSAAIGEGFQVSRARALRGGRRLEGSKDDDSGFVLKRGRDARCGSRERGASAERTPRSVASARRVTPGSCGEITWARRVRAAGRGPDAGRRSIQRLDFDPSPEEGDGYSQDRNDSLGEICAKREGRSAGRCLPTWFGICHAWAPAAMLLPEPQHEVVRNGVTFKVQDIKALASIVHDKTTSKFISLRCDANDKAGEITYDENGRADAACRDTNAGTYHIILANYLGLQKKSFVEDRTFDSEVWNQPMRGYKVLAKRAVSAEEANRLIGVKGTPGATKESAATVAARAWQDLQEVPVSAGDTYTVTMTGSGGDADLFVQFGARATSSSYTCKSDGSTANETCTGTVPAGATTMFVGVYGYSGTSTVSVKSETTGVASAYAFNADAVSFLYVKNAVSYISEIRSEQDGNMASSIDRYTGRDTYEYVLELDASGAIIGGEWVGESKKNHPDFLWLPTGAGSRSVAGGAIKYSEVKELVDASVK
jgi:Transglutaminase elicitor